MYKNIIGTVQVPLIAPIFVEFRSGLMLSFERALEEASELNKEWIKILS